MGSRYSMKIETVEENPAIGMSLRSIKRMYQPIEGPVLKQDRINSPTCSDIVISEFYDWWKAANFPVEVDRS
jgi:hypothetical protein